MIGKILIIIVLLLIIFTLGIIIDKLFFLDSEIKKCKERSK